jgi:hypothetical protein
MKGQRILAWLCLALSVPPCSFFLPWLPSTIIDRFRILRDLRVEWSDSYNADRQAQLQDNNVSLILYACGICALVGLVFIAFSRTERRWWPMIWLLACGTGFGIALFWSSSIAPGRPYGWWMTICFPISAAVVALLGLIFSLVRAVCLYSRPEKSCLDSEFTDEAEKTGKDRSK